MVDSVQVFFELIQVALGNRKRLSVSLTEEQWGVMLKMAMDQTIEGVLFESFSKLQSNEEIKDGSLVYYEWLGRTMILEQKNRQLDEQCEKALAFFRNNHFDCSVLKGQGMARLYPVPEHRKPGDIDIWVNGTRKEIYDFSLRTTNDIIGVNYHHIHYPMFDGTEVEVHIWPSYFSNPLYNSRFQHWCEQFRPTKESVVPEMAFNRVYILLHCYRHFTGHGLGMRQLMDYYYVLKQGFTEEERAQTVSDIRSFGMGPFCRAVMWFLQYVFGLEDCYLLMNPNAKRGKFILKEVMRKGNMGHADKRIDPQKAYSTPLRRFCTNTLREIYLIPHYPHEAIWRPFFCIYLYFWRLYRGLLR